MLDREQGMRYHKRPLKMLGLLAVLGILALVLLLRWAGVSDRAGINRVSFNKLHVGMTPAEVATILAAPPGTYSSGPVSARLPHAWPRSAQEWIGDEGYIVVGYNAQERVSFLHFGEVRPQSLSPVGWWHYLRRR